jgi:hypothetical protein
MKDLKEDSFWNLWDAVIAADEYTSPGSCARASALLAVGWVEARGFRHRDRAAHSLVKAAAEQGMLLWREAKG